MRFYVYGSLLFRLIVAALQLRSGELTAKNTGGDLSSMDAHGLKKAYDMRRAKVSSIRSSTTSLTRKPQRKSSTLGIKSLRRGRRKFNSSAEPTSNRFFRRVLDSYHRYGVIGEGGPHPALKGMNMYYLRIPKSRQDIQVGSQPISVMRRSREPDNGFKLPPDIDMHEDHPFDNELPLPAEEPVQMTIMRDKDPNLKFFDPDQVVPMMNFLWDQGEHHKRNKYIQGYEDKFNDIDMHGKVRNSLHGYHSNNNWKSGNEDAKSYHGGIVSYANNAYTSMQASDVMGYERESDGDKRGNRNPFLDDALLTNNEIWREIAQANKGYHYPSHRQGEKERFDDSLVGQGANPLQDGKIAYNTNSQHKGDPPFSWMPEGIEDLGSDGGDTFE